LEEQQQPEHPIAMQKRICEYSSPTNFLKPLEREGEGETGISASAEGRRDSGVRWSDMLEVRRQE
jgi:hypothetical protein